jgi:hypothetical protein
MFIIRFKCEGKMEGGAFGCTIDGVSLKKNMNFSHIGIDIPEYFQNEFDDIILTDLKKEGHKLNLSTDG